MMSDIETAANVSYGALCEVGRSDLADLALWFTDDDGSLYIEPMEELTGDDLALMERAERLALSAVQRSDLEQQLARRSGGEYPASEPTHPGNAGWPAGAAAESECDLPLRQTDANDERKTP